MLFNKTIGGLIADEFMDFKKFSKINDENKDELPSETEVMKYCC